VIPGVAVSAETAAMLTLKGIQGGDPEVIIGLAGRIKIAIDGLMPDWSSEMMDLLENAFPAATNLDAPAVQGKEIHGKIPDFTNPLVPERARP
jgi:hypothetical protein